MFKKKSNESQIKENVKPGIFFRQHEMNQQKETLEKTEKNNIWKEIMNKR